MPDPTMLEAVQSLAGEVHRLADIEAQANEEANRRHQAIVPKIDELLGMTERLMDSVASS